MLIMSDFESSVGYFNNYKLVMSQYIIQKPLPPLASSNRKPHHGKEKLAKAQGCQGMLVTSQFDTCIISVYSIFLNKFEYFHVLLL